MNSWTRKELKEKAKISFKANYWKCVLAALLLSLFAGGASGSFSGTITSATNGITSGLKDTHSGSSYEYSEDNSSEDIQSDSDLYMSEEDMEEISKDPDAANEFFNKLDKELQSAMDEVEPDTSLDVDGNSGLAALSIIGLIGLLFTILLVLLAIGIAAKVLFGNPLVVGLRKFFIDNANEKAKLGTIMQNFDAGYKNTVKTMFFMDLKLIGWTLLFIIPGIIKSYEYRMIPYLLADNPDMDRTEAHAASKAMMMGNKWKAFVLDLSFIGWFILSGLTLGILAFFYVNPYFYQTDANLYHVLKGTQTAAPAEPAEDIVEIVEADFAN